MALENTTVFLPSTFFACWPNSTVQHFGQNAHTGTADTDEMGGAEIRGAGRSIE